METLRGALTGSLLALRVATAPSPSHRPQVGKFGTYYAKGYQICMADCIKQMSQQKPTTPLEGDLAAVVEVVIQKPKKTILARPKGDADNYAKCPLDAAKKAGVWIDDGQVTALAVVKRWTEPGEQSGLTLTIGSIAA